jgi:hypothetical protein
MTNKLPESINVQPPKGTPPPPTGELLEDVKMAEQGPLPVDNDVEMVNHDSVHQEQPGALEINGRSPNVPSPASPPPESQRESPLHTQASQEASVADPDERPAKRPRKMSDSTPQPINGESVRIADR